MVYTYIENQNEFGNNIVTRGDARHMRASLLTKELRPLDPHLLVKKKEQFSESSDQNNFLINSYIRN